MAKNQQGLKVRIQLTKDVGAGSECGLHVGRVINASTTEDGYYVTCDAGISHWIWNGDAIAIPHGARNVEVESSIEFEFDDEFIEAIQG